MAPPDLTPTHRQTKKPGKAPTPFSQRIYRPKRIEPIKRPQKNYPRERKVEVLMFMYHHRVVLDRRDGISQLPRVPVGLEIISEKRLNGTTIFYRPPTYAETSDF